MRIAGLLLLSAAVSAPFLTVGAQPATDNAIAASAAAPENKLQVLRVARAAELRAKWAASGTHPAIVTFPSVISGRILTPTVDVQKAPGQAIVELTIASGTVGVSNVSITLTSPSGKHSVSNLSADLPIYPVAGRQTLDFLIQSPFANGGLGPYSESGPWKITNILLTPKDGDFISYDSALIAALFPSAIVHVTNANPGDITPPTIGVGKILTPTVSLSAADPVFAVSLPVADALSGVTSLSLSILPPGSSFPSFGAYAQLTAPARVRTVIAAGQLDPARNVPGIYTITNITACDFASNCREKTDPAEIRKVLGTTTFRVTK